MITYLLKRLNRKTQYIKELNFTIFLHTDIKALYLLYYIRNIISLYVR